MKRFVTFDTGPKSCHLEIENAYPYVISGGNAGRMRRVGRQFDKIYKIIESDRDYVTIHGQYKGLPVTAFSTGIGTPSAEATMAEIIEACDDPNMVILRLGTSGGLQPYLNIGDFVVTTDVDRHESTSSKIMKDDNYVAVSDKDVRHTLIAAANEFKRNFQKVYIGRTRVTDELYFGALEEGHQDHGDVLASSMEFSVYCALRDRYNRNYGQNIKVGNLLVISNNNVKKEQEQIDMTEFKRRQAKIEYAQIKAGLETLLRMSNPKLI